MKSWYSSTNDTTDGTNLALLGMHKTLLITRYPINCCRNSSIQSRFHCVRIKSGHAPTNFCRNIHHLFSNSKLAWPSYESWWKSFDNVWGFYWMAIFLYRRALIHDINIQGPWINATNVQGDDVVRCGWNHLAGVFAGCWRNAWKSTALEVWLCWFIFIVYILYTIYIWYLLYILYFIYYIFIISIFIKYMWDTWIIFMPWTCIVRKYIYI